jgi:hypothetical protein
MEQGETNSGYKPHIQLRNPDDANLILAIFVILWSRQLRAALRWMAHHPSFHTNTSAYQIDMAPASDTSPGDPACTNANKNPPPEGQ